MAQQATKSAESSHEHGDSFYVKIWAVLLGLLVLSVLGPTLGIGIVTLITAFGIALVKAYLVAKNFMHVNLEPRYVVYLLVTCVVLMLLLFAGVAPDVMRHDGQQWANLAAKAEVERVLQGSTAEAAPSAPLTPEAAFATVCSSCHGASGMGDGAAAAALNPKPANFQSPEFWETRDAAHVAKVIQGGGVSVGKSPLMPSFGGQFDEEAAKALAAYLEEQFRPKVAEEREAPVAVDAGAQETEEAPSDRGAAPANEKSKPQKPAREPAAPGAPM